MRINRRVYALSVEKRFRRGCVVTHGVLRRVLALFGCPDVLPDCFRWCPKHLLQHSRGLSAHSLPLDPCAVNLTFLRDLERVPLTTRSTGEFFAYTNSQWLSLNQGFAQTSPKAALWQVHSLSTFVVTVLFSAVWRPVQPASRLQSPTSLVLSCAARRTGRAFVLENSLGSVLSDRA